MKCLGFHELKSEPVQILTDQVNQCNPQPEADAPLAQWQCCFVKGIIADKSNREIHLLLFPATDGLRSSCKPSSPAASPTIVIDDSDSTIFQIILNFVL